MLRQVAQKSIFRSAESGFSVRTDNDTLAHLRWLCAEIERHWASVRDLCALYAHCADANEERILRLAIVDAERRERFYAKNEKEED